MWCTFAYFYLDFAPFGRSFANENPFTKVDGFSNEE